MQPHKVEFVSLEKFDYLCEFNPYEVTMNFNEGDVDPLDIIDYCAHTYGNQNGQLWHYGFHSETRVTIYLKSKKAATNFHLLAKMNWNIDDVRVLSVRGMPRSLVPYKNL